MTSPSTHRGTVGTPATPGSAGRPTPTADGPGATRGRVLAVIFGVVLVETVFQTLVPVVLTEVRGATGVTVGLALAVTHGASLVVSAPAAAVCDRRGPGRTVLASALLAAVSLVALVPLASDTRHELWVVPVVGYGIARGVTMMAALAMVARLRDPLATQGRNAATQRAAAVAGTAVAAVAIAVQGWTSGLVVLAVLGALALVVAARLPRPASPPIGARAALHGFVDVARLLRDQPGLRASTLLNVMTTLVFVLGNSFLPVVLLARTPDAATWVFVLVVCRDLVAVAAAFSFARLTRRLGVRGTLAVVAATVVASFVLLAVSLAPWALAAAALASGVSLGLAIGSTNLLATSAPGGGVAQRLSATFYAPALAALVVPVSLGAALDHWGAQGMYVLPAVLSVVLGLAVLHQARRAEGRTAEQPVDEVAVAAVLPEPTAPADDGPTAVDQEPTAALVTTAAHDEAVCRG